MGPIVRAEWRRSLRVRVARAAPGDPFLLPIHRQVRPASGFPVPELSPRWIHGSLSVSRLALTLRWHREAYSRHFCAGADPAIMLDRELEWVP